MICLITSLLSSFVTLLNLHPNKKMTTNTASSLKHFIEQELGSLTHFLIYAILEWFLILTLFLNGFLSFFSNEFAKFFGLHLPCVLCSRIEHVLVHHGVNSYYNSIICEHHKKDVSSLAYCRVHRNLSDIRTMCDGCLLSFDREKEAESQPKIPRPSAAPSAAAVADSAAVDGELRRCSCCGDAMKPRTGCKGILTRLGSSVHQIPMSPRSQLFGPRNEDGRPLHLQLKFMSGNDSDLLEDDYDKPGKEMSKSEQYDMNEESKTPAYSRNKFFGIPLDSSTPRLSSRINSIRKSPLGLDSTDLNPSNKEDEDSILNRLRRQVRSDQKALMELSLELDEERSASDIATNNAMAMITRLQAEKASVQMEASQYQRMMEEQAQYDQEAIQILKDILMKRSEELRNVEAELENYRYKFGILEKDGYNEFDGIGDAVDDYQEFNSRSYSFVSERYECETPVEGSNHLLREEYSPRMDDSLEEEEEEGEEKVEEEEEEEERSELYGLLTVLEKKMYLTANEEELVSPQPNSEMGDVGNNHLIT